MFFILLGSLAGFAVFYGVKSTLSAKRDSQKNKAYRDAVNKHLVRGGGKLKSKYSLEEQMEGNNNFRYVSLLDEDL